MEVDKAHRVLPREDRMLELDTHQSKDVPFQILKKKTSQIRLTVSTYIEETYIKHFLIY